MEHYLSELNEAQQRAVMTTEGPVLVVAGAGAGKTKTIAYRALHLAKKGVAEEEILAITFTNKAAGEMRERIRGLLGSAPGRGPSISTFHSLGVRLLREFSAEAKVKKNFAIFDRDDSKKAVKAALEAAGIDPKRYEPGKVLSAISRAKGDGKTPEAYALAVKSSFEEIAARAFIRYEMALRQEGALDFDDLIARLADLLDSDEGVRDRLHRRWRYIHVDEYQDTNKVQYRIARRLAEKTRNICVVGDGDQSIYGWRGADIKNILSFEEDYPDAAVILLEQNYRSTGNVLSAAANVIEKNKLRKDKRLFTENPDGEKVGLFAAYDEEDEARFVAKRAHAYIRRGTPAEEIAVLYRANFQSRALEQAFLQEGVPYQLVGTRFFERKEVKDALSYLRIALDGERGADLRRVLNTPVRGLGKVALLSIIEGKEASLPRGAAGKLAEFRAIISDIRQLAETERAASAMKGLLERSGLWGMYAKGKGEDAERLENLRELVTVAARYDGRPPGEGLRALIDDASLMSDQDELSEERLGVKLMTIHAAKGLEWDVVFVTGLEEGLFPHDGNGTKTEAELEEERRLCYVAITRAKKKLILSYAGIRTIFGSRAGTLPSSFLSDIPDAILEAEQGEQDGFKTIYI